MRYLWFLSHALSCKKLYLWCSHLKLWMISFCHKGFQVSCQEKIVIYHNLLFEFMESEEYHFFLSTKCFMSRRWKSYLPLEEDDVSFSLGTSFISGFKSRNDCFHGVGCSHFFVFALYQASTSFSSQFLFCSSGEYFHHFRYPPKILKLQRWRIQGPNLIPYFLA